MKRIAIRTGSDLGLAIAEARRARGLTQAELAERSGMSAAYISKIESGRSSSLLDHAVRLLRRLGVDLVVEVPDV